MSRQAEIQEKLVFLAEQAYAGRLEAVFVVDVRRTNEGRAYTTVNMLSDLGTGEQTARILEHLQAISDELREIYAEGEEVKR